MSYGPWAMIHASRLLIHGPRSNKLSIIFFSLELGAWRLELAACSLVLGAWRLDLGPVSMGHGPCFMVWVDLASVWHKSR